MGQQRTDTSIQLAAKRRGAEQRRCRHCGRGNAMSARHRIRDAVQNISWRECRYCGYVKGINIVTGELFEKVPA